LKYFSKISARRLTPELSGGERGIQPAGQETMIKAKMTSRPLE
jgi:hypothetical protein